MNMIIISGPSGAGKSTVVKELIRNCPDEYEFVKSVTTREPRSDTDTEYYTFVSEQTFQNMLLSGDFLETNIYQGNNNSYGTPRREVERIQAANRIPILEIDVNGKVQILANKELFGFEPISIFITVPPRALYDRLVERGESVEAIVQRLSVSCDEVRRGLDYDAFIVNHDMDITLDEVKHAIAGDYKSRVQCVEDYQGDMACLIKEIDDRNSLSALMKRVEQFCKIRSWDQFNNPKDLAIGISTEANELLDIFRFKTDMQMEQMMCDSEYRSHIGEELADTFFFLLRFCAKFNFNPGDILVDKIIKNDKKYPVSMVKGFNLKRNEFKCEA